MTEPLFTVSKEDWSLHRKGYQDQTRHQQKVREAIKQNLPDLVTDESIVLSNGKQIVKVPIRSLDEYRFRYNYNKSKHVGQGDGDSEVGDVLGVDPAPSSGAGKGEGAGDQAGEDYYEAEVNMEELQTMLFEELELPNLQNKQKHNLTAKEVIFNDIRKKGIMSNIDKKKTILQNLRRNSSSGDPGIHGISPDDLRFKTWDEIEKPHSNALIIAMMDTSGSPRFTKLTIMFANRFPYANEGLMKITTCLQCNLITLHEYIRQNMLICCGILVNLFWLI